MPLPGAIRISITGANVTVNTRADGSFDPYAKVTRGAAAFYLHREK